MNWQEVLTAFTLGIASTLNPCVLPLFPGFLVYLGGLEGRQKGMARFLPGVLILSGVLSSMLLLGLVISALSVSIGSVLIWIIPITDLLIIILGVLTLLNINPFMRFSSVRQIRTKNSSLSAFLYGLLYGPLTFPCSGPLIIGIFAYSFTVSEALDKLFVFLAFGLGMGLPLIFLSLLSGTFQRQIVQFIGRNSNMVKIAGGVLLIAIGIFHLVYNREMFALFL